MNLFYTILPFIGGALCSSIIVPLVIRESNRRNLLDIPDHRKEHKIPTPTMGGLGLFGAFVLSSSLFMIYGSVTEYLALVLSFVALLMVGVKDDSSGMDAKTKLFIHLGLGLFVLLTVFQNETFNGIPLIGGLSYPIKIILLSVFIAGVTNAWNLIDGINGLSGGLGTVNALIFGILFLLCHELGYAVLALGLAGGLLGFLRYNFPKARIFMGDTGSLHLGFFMAVFSLKLSTIAPDVLKFNAYISSPWLWIMALQFIPVFDCCRVFLFRILKHKGPFSPDRSHVHHLLLKNGMDHVNATLTLLIIQFILITISHTFSGIPLLYSSLFLFCIGVLFIELLSIRRIKVLLTELKNLQKRSKQLTNTGIRHQLKTQKDYDNA